MLSRAEMAPVRGVVAVGVVVDRGALDVGAEAPQALSAHASAMRVKAALSWCMLI